MEFQKDVLSYPDSLNVSSGIVIDKGRVVIGNAKHFSRLRDMSVASPNGWQSSWRVEKILFFEFFPDLKVH